jgi:hypothetical protein
MVMMQTTWWRGVLVAVLFCAVAIAAGDEKPNTAPLVVPVTREAPEIDGFIGEEEWRVSASFDSFQRGGRLERRRVQGFVAARGRTIYVAIRSQLPDEGALQAGIKRDSLRVVHDDSVEIYVNPAPQAADNVDYQMLANSLGRGGYNIHALGRPEEKVSWRGDWEQAHGFHDGYWHFECAIPVRSMRTAGAERKVTEGLWRINLTRNWKRPWRWSSLAGGYARGGLTFRFTNGPAPAAHFRFEGGCFVPPFTGTMTLHNPSEKPLHLRASLVLDRAEMPTVRTQDVFSLASGKRRSLTLKVAEGDPTTLYDLRLRVMSGDDETTFYRRSVSWRRAGEPHRWVAVEQKDRPPIDFRFAYYPYRNRMRLLADITGLAEEAKPERVLATVRPVPEGETVRTVELPVADFENGRCETAFDLPELEGRYEIALRVEGQDVPEEPRIKPFRREKYPWEHTPTGRSTEVYAPFKPIELDRAAGILRTVLRQHRLNDAGLMDGIEATSAHTGVARQILAAPMRYVVRAGGEKVPVEASDLRYTDVADHEVVTEGEFRAGPLRAEFRDRWDYDGCLRVELTLELTGGEEVEEMRLEIPLKSSEARLIHANADRIRAPVAKNVPEGDGVVWDATEVAYNDFPRTFCPYVFLGNGARGFCWFADNDRGWLWDDERPNLDVVREGDRVILRVHLINEPGVVEEQRKIVFGLLGAPVKPMLREEDTTKHWWRYRYNRDRYTVLGTCINWLSIGSASNVYPAGKDLYLWEMIARGNRRKLPREKVKAVIEHGRRYYEPFGEGRVESFERHVAHNLRARRNKKMIFYYNRASNKMTEEFHTFKDEWALQDWRSYGPGNKSGEIKIVPSESYIDFALYWYSRSFEIGRNRGVYWDNFFIAPSFNTGMSAAYRLPDGTIRPSAGIWALRRLAKRTFVMMNEKRMFPITMAHMTSFNPLPMLSFCTVQYDWEWKYGQGHTQDRFSRELIRLMTTGELAGAWPVLLGGRGKNLWQKRTYAAVRLLHELDGGGGWQPLWNDESRSLYPLARPFLRLLEDESEDLVVYRYWDERPQPATTSDPDVPTIVYSVPGEEAVVGVVSYRQDAADVQLDFSPDTLGFDEGCTVLNVETEETLPVRDGAVSFRLKSHDVRVLRMTAGQ